MIDDRGGRRGQDAPGYSAHHGMPLGYGGDVGDALVPPPVLPVNRAALRRPANPGMPPSYHIPLPEPETYRLPLPPGFASPARRDARPPETTSAFPPLAPAAGPAADAAPALQAGSAESPDAAPTLTPVPVQRFDPVYPLLLFLALGVGTFYIHLEPITRYTLLWTVLAALGAGLTLFNSRGTPRLIAAAGLGWGASFGLVFSLPLFILVGSGLAGLVGVLYPAIGPATLFQSLVFVGPLGETLFFRGALQERRGFVASVLGAGLSGLIFYWPATSQAPIYLLAAGLFTTVLAGVYSFIRTRYGLIAAYVCQVTVNLLLLFMPSLLFA